MPTVDQIVHRQAQRWELEARSRARAGGSPRGGKPYPFVTISRDHGSSGGVIAERVAERLGWVCLNRQIADYVAAHARVRKQIIDLLDEHTRGYIETWIRGHITGRYLDESDYARHLASVVHSFIHHDPAVILGRGGVYILAGLSQYGLHVRITAPFDIRVRRVAEAGGLAPDAARARVLSVDHDRADFLRRVFHRDGRDPLDYDLVINTARYTVETAAETITRALEIRGLVHPGTPTQTAASPAASA